MTETDKRRLCAGAAIVLFAGSATVVVAFAFWVINNWQ